jgi:hypothetical protein
MPTIMSTVISSSRVKARTFRAKRNRADPWNGDDAVTLKDFKK